MASVLGYGMWLPSAGSTHGDFTPIASMLVAVLIARFVIGLRLTPMSIVAAAFAGALWAYLAERWGLPAATALGVLTVIVASVLVRGTGRRGGLRSTP
jgi:hypothetical protein